MQLDALDSMQTLSALSDETPQSCMDLNGLSREAADKSAVTTISATLPAMYRRNDLPGCGKARLIHQILLQVHGLLLLPQ